jgi:hypothetical protein
MDSRKIYYLSLILYASSLILPFDGKWLGGLGLMIVTGFWSLLTIAHNAQSFKFENLSFNLLIIILPFFNIIYLVSAIRFKKYESLITPTSAMLFLSTIIAVVYAVFIIISGVWKFYLYLIWCGALVSLVTAIILKWKSA